MTDPSDYFGIFCFLACSQYIPRFSTRLSSAATLPHLIVSGMTHTDEISNKQITMIVLCVQDASFSLPKKI